MKLIDRFTLDDVSAKVWWPLALLILIGLVLTFPAGNRAADETRAAAASHAAELSTARIQLAPTLPATSLESLVRADEPQQATEVLTAYAEDPIWSDVRVWTTPDLSLWATSASQEQSEIGSAEANNDDALKAALDHGTSTVVTDRLATGGDGPTTFHAYTRIAGVAGNPYVTEFEARDSVLLADVHREWLGYRIIGVVAFLLVLGLAIASMREPRARIGANVPFYAESVPAGQAIIAVDRAAELKQADDRVQDRITGLQERLDESERLRLKAEAQLQQALTALGSGSRGISAPKPVEPRVEEKAEPPRRAPRPADTPKPAAAPARPKPAVQPQPRPAVQPIARSKQPVEQKPAVQPKPVVQPKPAAAASAARSPEPQHAKTPPPPVTTQQPAAKAPPPPPKRRPGKHAKVDPVTVRAEEVAVTAAANGESPSDVVVVPQPDEARVGAKARGADTDAEVLDVLNRLVPTGEQRPSADEPGDLRARLARTAALKKPGSRERQELRDAPRGGPTQE